MTIDAVRFRVHCHIVALCRACWLCFESNAAEKPQCNLLVTSKDRLQGFHFQTYILVWRLRQYHSE